MAFFTDFRTRGNVGLFDWYTISAAIFVTVLLAAHGATYLTLKTEGPVHDRAARYAKRLWVAVVPLFFALSVESWIVRPDLFHEAVHKPLCWLGVLCHCRLSRHACFRPGYSQRNARVRWFEWPHRGRAGNRSRSSLPGDAAFNPCSGEFTDRVRRRFQPQRFGAGFRLVPNRSGTGHRLFQFYFPALCGKSQPQAARSTVVRTERRRNYE